MRVSGLDDKEKDNYFIAMMTGKEMRPSIEGSGQQGYHEGIKAGSGQGRPPVTPGTAAVGVRKPLTIRPRAYGFR